MKQKAPATSSVRPLSMLGLVMLMLVGACSTDSESGGAYRAEKPMFRDNPTLSALRPEARLPNLGNVPTPNLLVASTVLIDETTGTVYKNSTTSILKTSSTYTEIRTIDRSTGQCNPVTVTNAVTLAGLMEPLLTLEISSLRCPDIGSSHMRVEAVEVQNVDGILFPLAVGNTFSFKQRELLRDRDDLLGGIFGPPSGPDTVLSNKERWMEYQYAVVERLPTYKLNSGKDIGETFVIRRTIVDGPVTYESDWYFSTKLRWPVLRRESNGAVIKLLRWE